MITESEYVLWPTYGGILKNKMTEKNTKIRFREPSFDGGGEYPPPHFLITPLIEVQVWFIIGTSSFKPDADAPLWRVGLTRKLEMAGTSSKDRHKPTKGKTPIEDNGRTES